VAEDRTVLAFDRADLVLLVGLGLAVCAFTAEVLRFGAVRDLVAVPADLVAVRDFAAVVAGRPAVRALLTELADLTEPAGLAPVRDLAAVVADRAAVRPLAADFGLATRRADDAALAAGIALTDDMDLAATVSDFAAVVMALVAVFIACMAVDIVLADDVALVAAAVILVAADVTLVAADDTVRAAVAVDGEFLGAAPRVDLVARDFVLAFLFGRLAARLGALPLVGLVRALAELRRAAVRVVVRAGTDLPPSRSITGVLFHTHRGFTHRCVLYLQNNGRKTTKTAAISPGEAASGRTYQPGRGGSARPTGPPTTSRAPRPDYTRANRVRGPGAIPELRDAGPGAAHLECPLPHALIREWLRRRPRTSLRRQGRLSGFPTAPGWCSAAGATPTW
jgi:hypothetical protein